MKSALLTPSRLRIILTVTIFLTIIGAVIGFFFIQKVLYDYAESIGQLNAEAAAGSQNLQTLKQMQQRIEQEDEAIEKTKSIVAQSREYKFQDQIVNDLSRISEASGVTITSFDFAGALLAENQAASTTATPPATAKAPNGLKSEKVAVTVKSPLAYDNLMKFIKAIEKNSLKMQIANVSMIKGDTTGISLQTFIIEVYVK